MSGTLENRPLVNDRLSASRSGQGARNDRLVIYRVGLASGLLMGGEERQQCLVDLTPWVQSRRCGASIATFQLARTASAEIRVPKVSSRL